MESWVALELVTTNMVNRIMANPPPPLEDGAEKLG